MSTQTTPDRPSWNPEIKEELSITVGKILHTWCKGETDLQDCIDDAAKVLEYHRNDDGYELAKQFEDEGYMSDSELVDLLDGISSELREILQRHFEQWVKKNNLSLDLPIGSAVKFQQGSREIIGEVVNHRPDTYFYCIWYPEIGGEKGKRSVLVPAEKVTLIE